MSVPATLRRQPAVAAAVPALVVAGAAAGLALRIWILLSSQSALDGDEAVWGEMARHVLRGELPVFFWNQQYGGTQEIYLTAPLVWLFGLSATTIRIVPIALWALSALLVWRIGRRILDEPRARLAAVLFWIWPAYFVWKSTRAHGFYGSTLVLGLAVVLLALRLRERDSRRDLVLLGLAAGCGWWASPQIVVLAVPALVWLLRRRPTVARGWWLAVPAAVVGGLPWLVWNVGHHWASFHPGTYEGTRYEHLHDLVVATLPTTLGLRVPWSLEWIGGPAVGAAAYVLLLAGFAWLALRRRDWLGLPLLAAVLFPVFYVVSPYTWLNTEPRYLAELTPVLALLVGWSLRPAGRAAAVLALALALSAAGLAAVERDNLSAIRVEGVAVPGDVAPLVHVLRSAGVRYGFANYWVAWPATFASGERIVVAASSESHPSIRGGRVYPGDETFNRHDEFHRAATRSGQAAHVFLAGGNVEPRVRPLLRRAGYRRVVAGGFVVYLPPARRTLGGG